MSNIASLGEGGDRIELCDSLRHHAAVGFSRYASAAMSEAADEIEALRSTIKEYCDSDEVSADFGFGCFSKQYINEIRRRHGLIDEPKGGVS